MLGSVRDVIETGFVAWARFDPAWYVQRYPEAQNAISDSVAASARSFHRSDAVVEQPASSSAEDTLSGRPSTDLLALALEYYLTKGQSLGHSPNPWFDEAWYLKQYPEAAEAVRDRTFTSGFDEYCQRGYGGRSPHWLYNDYLYRVSGEELTHEKVRAEGFANRYDHYLQRGCFQGRRAHPLFDAAVYRAGLNEAEAAESDRLGPFQHFLLRLHAGWPEKRASSYFDPDWYRLAYPDVTQDIGSKWLAAIHHYLTNETPTRFDPLPDFSESAYLARYPDIAAGLEAGNFRNGYQHFLSNGVFELRAPNDDIDLRQYVSAHSSVTEDLDRDRARDAFDHLLRIGRPSGLTYAPVSSETEEERQAKAAFRLRAENLLPGFARHPLDFTFSGNPDLSVIMVLHDNFALTMQSLGSLRQNFPGNIELVLFDSGSTDETSFIERYIKGAIILRIDINVGFVKGCNAGFVAASGPAVLLLNNDVELAPGAVDAALSRLWSDPKIGVVGGKIVRTHGRLQEAGCIIWRDGTTLGYMRNADPLTPEANFVRDVDYCSGAFLLLRGDLARELEGFSDDFAPAYYEDVDLCVRVAQAGFRVVYDPAIMVHHYEYGSAANYHQVELQSVRSRRVFLKKHAEYLRHRYIANRSAEVFARSAGLDQHRVLVIDDRVPLRMLGSGFVRTNDVIRAMTALGAHVTVFPVYSNKTDVPQTFGDFPDSVEVMYNQNLESLREFLELRDGFYNAIWIVRTHNLDRVYPMLQQHLIGKGKPPRIILDTEAVAAPREMQRLALVSDSPQLQEQPALELEFSNSSLCQEIIAVTTNEAKQIQCIAGGAVTVLGHTREVQLTPRPFEARSGILFVGAIHELNSPNYDSLCWFVDEVLPLIEPELGWETRLTVAGYIAPNVLLNRFHQHSRVTLLGPVFDTAPLYDRNRVFVAPTRYAAGAPYKIYEAASFGIPVVASELVRQQLGWRNGEELLSADISDPAGFARHVLSVYRDVEQWERIRLSAAKRLTAENTKEQYEETIRSILDLR